MEREGQVVAMEQHDPGPVKAFKWLEETLGFGRGGTITVLVLLVVFALILISVILAVI
jgi:hypothetical protein